MSDYHSPVKPGAITAIQVIAWIKVGLISLGLCGMFALLSQVEGRIDAEASGLITLALGVLVAVLIAYIVIAINIPKGHNWARIMTVVVEAINLASLPFTLGNLAGASVGGAVIGAVLSVVMIACAVNADARRYCEEMA